MTDNENENKTNNMILRKIGIMRDKILMLALSTHNNNRYEYKIFVFNMIADKTNVSGNPIQGFDAISPNFETLDYVHKSGLSEHKFKKMFSYDWEFLENKLNK